MSWKSDGTQLASVSRDGKVRLFDPRAKESPLQVKLFLNFSLKETFS